MKKKIIAGSKTGLVAYFHRVFEYRAMIYSFAVREIKAQYSQTFLGILWGALRPLAGVLIYTLFFHYLLNVNTGKLPYSLFALCGMMPWYYFTYLVADAGVSVVQSKEIIKKVYFPKLILPFAKVLVGFVDFGIAFLILIILMASLGYTPTLKFVLLPIFIALNIATGLSVGIWLSALTMRYRDFHQIIPYLIGFGIFLTPVFFPSTLIPTQYQFFIYINPMAGVIEGFRWCLLNAEALSPYYLIGFIPMLILLVGGLVYFKNIEGEMADIV